MVSGGELGVALACGVDASRIFYSGVGKLDRELDQAIGAGSRGPITEKIQSAFFDIVNGRNPKYAEWLSKV